MDLVHEQWIDDLAEDCKDIAVERGTIINWEKILMYHELGTRLIEEKNLNPEEKHGKEILQRVGEYVGLSTSSLYSSIQFVKAYPDMEELAPKLPNGKAITWHYVANYLLTGRERETGLRGVRKTRWDILDEIAQMIDKLGTLNRLKEYIINRKKELEG